jgi:hypothetical protein
MDVRLPYYIGLFTLMHSNRSVNMTLAPISCVWMNTDPTVINKYKRGITLVACYTDSYKSGILRPLLYSSLK